jgi:hypothetical protein
MAPTASVTPTVTSTPTPTPTANYPDLCFFVDYKTGTINGPLQFTRNGGYNGRPSWAYFNGATTTYLRWNIELGRWQMYDWTLGQGTLVNTSNTYLPIAGWQSEGNPVQAIVTVSQGTCPAYAPLQMTVTTDSTTCGDTPPYDGGISIAAQGGRPPYTYSIDNGSTFASSNVFSQLANGSYTVVVRDAVGNTATSQATIVADATAIAYQISVSTSGVTQINSSNYQGTWCVEVTPEIPVGSSIRFNLAVNDFRTIDSPGTATGVTTTVVYKNGTEQTTTNLTSTDNTSTRPNCDPYTRFETATSRIYDITMSRGDIISGVTTSLEAFLSPTVASNGCATRIEQNVVVLAQSPVFSNCSCCTVTALKVYGGIPSHVLTYVESLPQPNPTITMSNLSDFFNTECEACNARIMVDEVYTYVGTSPEVGMTMYSTNTGGILSTPFAGGNYFYKFNWGGSLSTIYDVVQIDDNGKVLSLTDCETDCGALLEVYTGSGFGETPGQAGNDAILNNRTLYSTCNSLSFGPLCPVYLDTVQTPLIGYTNVFMNGANYDVNPTTGIITGYGGIQD